MFKQLKQFALPALLLTCGAAQAEHCELRPVAEMPVTIVNGVPTALGKVNGVEAQFIVDSSSVYNQLSWEFATQLNLAMDGNPLVEFYSAEMGRSFHPLITTVREFIVGNKVQRNRRFLVGTGVYAKGIAGVVGLTISPLDDADYDLANGVIRVLHPHDCGDADLAYWAGSMPHSVIGIDEFARTPNMWPRAEAYVNGTPIRVMFSTGARNSMLTKRAAARLGISPETPGVSEVAYEIQRDGVRTGKAWIATFSSFRIGAEEIRNAQLQFADADLPDCDMLLGADFFLAHHVYFTTRHRKLYFTYNGGPVFKRSIPGTSAAAAATSAPEATPAVPATATH